MPKAHVVTKFCNCSLVLQDLYSTSVGWMKRTRKRPYIAKSINHQYFQHSTHKGIIRRPYKGIIRRPYIAKSMSHQYFQHSTHKGVISGCQEWNNSTWVGKKKKKHLQREIIESDGTTPFHSPTKNLLVKWGRWQNSKMHNGVELSQARHITIPCEVDNPAWTWHRALPWDSFTFHFTFKIFRKRHSNEPHGCLYGLGTGIGFQR
jgi:hypothetical protein